MHVGAGVSRPVAHTARPHTVPSATGDQSLVDRAGSQVKHGFDTCIPPGATHSPPITHPVAIAYVHACVISLQMSTVHERMSSHALTVSTHIPARLHVDIALQ